MPKNVGASYSLFRCLVPPRGTCTQARNPGSAEGRSHARKFSPPPGKMCWTQFENIGHSSKNLGPSRKSLRPSWCPKLVTGLRVHPVKNHCLCITNIKLNCIAYRLRFLLSALIVMHFYVKIML